MIENDRVLANEISRVVLEHFNGLKIKSGKPIVRSNGKKEWTVLASMVALFENAQGQVECITPITITTGVKTLPDEWRIFSKGMIVHDLHAEILSFRLFNWFLIDECTLVDQAECKDASRYVALTYDEHGNRYFSIKPGIKFALFTTEPPCGDLSMRSVSDGVEDNSAWEYEIKKNGMAASSTRGRAHFDRLGIVRTKPGRGDSILSLSKSCSDKICMKQLTGLCNAITANLFPNNIFLSYLVIKDKCVDETDVKRCFESRFECKIESKTLRPISILWYDEDTYEYHRSKDAIASQLSILYLVPNKTVQILNNGVRNGTFVKKKTPSSSASALISNRNLYSKACPLLDSHARSYQELKTSNYTRESLKKLGRDVLGNWLPTSKDDFEFV
ncbi:Piso0_002419 [Millerozyma farinosa CBS 7064]|uniref:Piso0_002419 protein n=1 Tax=Pichia sorbitophila (strain ATCC MYA-4447 / BCRC 22081 / CBS 7064 / NBRC 10061 / NRRL Y-12695) TaxID=559304 RepID=G8YCK0_PICSO|nr:Piso0_002419 [Millerozyma farinosa CBS 7064]